MVALAIPAKRGVYKTIKLDNGKEVKVELRGDEFLNWWQAEDGSCFRLGSNATYKQIDLKQEIKKTNPLRSAQKKQSLTRAATSRATQAYTGKKKGLIILVQFSDVSFDSRYDRDFYDKMANEIGYSKGRQKGSVKDYFLTQSNGQFELDFDVYGPVTLTKNRSYYGAHSGSMNDAHANEMVSTACRMLDDQIDFSKYDWDGDGYVEQVFVIYAGNGEADSGIEETVWPHKSALSSWENGYEIQFDGVAVDVYACTSELAVNYIASGSGYVTRNQVAGIGTLCHEYSHCFGLPDMYDVNYTGYYGTGTWDLLDSGSYNGNGYVPCNYTAYEKMFVGWDSPIVLDKPTTVKNMKSASDYGSSFIIYNDAYNDEYYLLENRQLTDWDKSLYGAGLIVTHVDYSEKLWYVNCVNTNVVYDAYYNDHQRCAIVPADNDTQNTLSSVIGDAYPYESYDEEGNTVINNSLTATSSPMASLYNANSDGSYLLNKDITNIVQNEDGTISFDFMGGSDTNIISGIEKVKASSDGITRVYNLQGVLIYTCPSQYFNINNIPQKGILIVKNENGTQKVVR